MIVDAIGSFLSKPAIAAGIEKLSQANKSGFNHSIDGLIVGIAVGILGGLIVCHQAGKDKDPSNGLGYAFLTLGVFAGSVLVVTTAFAVYGFAKGLLC